MKRLIRQFLYISAVGFFTLVFHVILRPFYSIKTRGIEKLPSKGPYIIVSNHESYIDGPLISTVLKIKPLYIADWIYFRLPIFNWFVKFDIVIPIAPRKLNPVVLEKAYSKISEVLSAGEILFLFPEGFVSRDGQTASFKTGIEKIISKNPVPIYPMAITGLWGSIFSWKYGKVFFKLPDVLRRTVCLSFGEPIYSQDFSIEKIYESVLRLKDV